jgi:hypothetical protein
MSSSASSACLYHSLVGACLDGYDGALRWSASPGACQGLDLSWVLVVVEGVNEVPLVSGRV